MASNRKHVPAWRRLIELLVVTAVSTFVIFLLSATALVIYTRGVAGPATVSVIIAEGSGDLVESGQGLAEVPPVWTFNDGDTLVLDNQDSVTHMLGSSTMAPGETLTIEMDAASGGDLTTTLHPTGFISINVEPSGFDFSIIAFTTFAFGIAVGVTVYAGVTIFRAMGHHDDDDWSASPDETDRPG